MEMDQLQTQLQAESPFCRLCFVQGPELYELFPGAGNDNESLLIKILDCVTVEISFDNDYNSYICGKCVSTVEEFFDYKEKVKENDAILREKRKSVDHTAIYNVVNMQPDGANSSNSNGQELTAIDESQVAIDHRITIEGSAPLNGNIIEFKKQLFTAAPEQMGIWICVASGSDIQCPAMIQVDDNVQVVAEIGHHNHGLPVSVADPPQETKHTVITDPPKPTPAPKKRKAKDQQSKRKVSNDILVGDGWLVDVTSQKRHHYQLVTKDGYQTFLIFNGYRFRTQQKIRNGIASWKCAWNGRKGCQAVLHITEDYQKVKEVGSSHNHEPSLRDRIISSKPSNGAGEPLMGHEDGEELNELQHRIATIGSVHNNVSTATTTTATGALHLGEPTTANSTTISSAAVAAAVASGATTLDLNSEIEFVPAGSNGSELVATVVDNHHHHHHDVVSVVDDVAKDDTTMPMDIEEIIRPHVVLHPANE